MYQKLPLECPLSLLPEEPESVSRFVLVMLV